MRFCMIGSNLGFYPLVASSNSPPPISPTIMKTKLSPDGAKGWVGGTKSTLVGNH